MVVRKLTQEEFCLVLQRIILRLGADRALRRDNGNRQLYSGPDWEIGEELKRDFRNAGLKYLTNWHISEQQAAREGAVRIDDTYIGKLLSKIDLQAYFFEVYKNVKQAADAEYEVWAYASRAFVAAGSEKALTASCGANADRVYRREKLDEMDKQRNYKTINDKYAEAELDVFRRDKEKFQRRTSLIELRRTLRAAHDEILTKGTTSIATEYYRRKEFYLLQRRNQFRAAGKAVPKIYNMSFDERRKREAVFVLKILNFKPSRITRAPSVVAGKAAVI